MTNKFLLGKRGFVAMQGCIYHQVWLNHHGSAVKWLLYDGFLNENMLHQTIAHSIPAS